MWDHPNPVFIDWETQSQADISEVGGRLYAYHPSTRPLILSTCIDGTFHVWIPDYIRCKLPAHSRLWPNELKPAKEVKLYRGEQIPLEIRKACAGRPLVAHNAYGFDQFIWERFVGEATFLDSMYLARISGRHGGLDRLSKQLLGHGKDRAKKLLPLLTTATETVFYGKKVPVYPVISAGDLAAFTTYAIADVEILVRLWNQFEELQVESDVIDTHNRINDRGIAVDENLIDVIEQVSIYSVNEAANEISRLTGGKLNANNLRSGQKVHLWLSEWGIDIVDDAGKKCLRKDVVQRYIDSPYLLDSDNLTAAREIPPLVIKVLELRLKALRITDAKVKRAKKRVYRGRVYDLHSYHQAHTGRASSSGIQIHNLPRPPKGLNIQELINAIQSEGFSKVRNDSKGMFDFIKEEKNRQAQEAKKEDIKQALADMTVDDVMSALIRPSFVAKKDHSLVLVDFSTVEARGVAWIAGEDKLLKVFTDQDSGVSPYGPYEHFASKMFGVPVEQVDSFQRQVAKPVVLGAGYGMGLDKMRLYAAAMGVDLVKAGVTSEYCINLFRDTYTKIAGWKPDKNGGKGFRVGGIWKTLEKAVKETVSTGEPRHAGKCTWIMDRRDLVCVLPSGRQIRYPDAKIEDIVPAYAYTMGLELIPKATVTYQSTRGTKSLYGGLITENVVQAICRDLLMCALVQFEANKWNPVAHVHDEGVCEVPTVESENVLRGMVRIMSTAPDWAEGFPVACEGFISPRFVKKAFKGYREMTTRELAV